MIKKGIRRQIVLHYFFVVFLALLLVEVIFMFALRSYYYDSIYKHIESRIESVSEFAPKFKEPEQSLQSYLLNTFSLPFTELQLLDEQGNVIDNSTNFAADLSVQTSDVTQALAGDTGKWIGKQPSTGQQVMAVSQKLDNIVGDQVYVIRYTTSLELVNDKLFTITLFSLGIMAAVLVIVFVVSTGLANSIVRPINNIRDVSAQMAQGRFDARIEGDYRYELGELASTLNYMAQEIVRTNQIKDDFISSISHELRTPLTSIKGWSETLNSGGYDPEETKIGMKIISKETDRLIGLVEEILDFSKLEQNAMKLVMGTVDLRELLQEIMLNVWAKAEMKQIKLQLDSEETAYLVHGDGNRLKQVFLNIVDNAIKFSHESSIIFLSLQRIDGNIEISVQDTGIGISAENLARVRDRFFQVDHQNGGTGLGLAISQQFIERHHGQMLIRSELGAGTTITVSLPALQAEQSVEPSQLTEGLI
ncbi:sensor histidine kinase [Paenibacillus polymyxa]|jgi:signal transduction histidine kinase|uniref:sensor histidine kinase n=1 Tax=Paenibacillus TaxID=44249 RepID=UPI0008FCC230|nr:MULTISPECIES: HAMP domain-containing sensor histidine kinase [Paenibacillus]APB71034.1 sensor histidine kinase [Paenibacillus polymyxa]KAF6580352.1 HAMP domain-containing histidine kinase [Paenibacillus sp. EKM212P]MBP1176668.1 signal transduction histidine kinase [Paenibacillus sp. PvR133]MXO79808.1 HAMP domain-containing protein [Paenibacillus sp. OT2-17]OMF45660.1 two-component sensor histidine kinase [Paenibacillus peoriae]